MTRSLSSAGQAIACTRFLPAPLIAARAAVFDPLKCLDLNLTARRTLYGILTFLNLANKAKAIFPRRDTLRAESLLQSDATLYRGLALLEAKEYISRAQKRNERDGKFYLSPIALTQKALVLLGLGEVINSKPSLEMRDGLYKKELTKEKQSYQKTASKQDLDKKSSIDASTRLPVELMPLLDLAVSKSAVCWLMNQAKKFGKRLGDVFNAVHANVRPLRGKAVVAYLMALIKKDIDFKWVAKEKDKQASGEDLDANVKEKLEQLDSRYAGFEAVHQDGRILGVFSPPASKADIAFVHGATSSTPVNFHFVKAWMDGIITLRRPRQTSYFDEEF